MKSLTILTAALLLLGLSGAASAQTSSDLLFTQLAPCRLFDSSKTTALQAGASRSVYVGGPAAVQNQGGATGGCKVPTWATAVAVSLASSASSTTGTLLASVPGTAGTVGAMALLQNLPQVANVTIGVNAYRFVLRPSAGSTQITADVTGYYAPQIAAEIANDGSIFHGTSRILSSTRTGLGSYTVKTDRDVSACALALNIASGKFYGDAFVSGTNMIIVKTWSLDSTATPVPFDVYFFITAAC